MTSIVAASRPAPPPVPSHSTFLRAQIRSSLAHLRATSDLDNDTFQQIDNLLSHGGGGKSATQDDHKSRNQNEEEKMLGGNNAWLRKALIETDLLSNTISLAMSVAVPSALLGSTQQEAIIELVEMSKEKIANAITDSLLQKRTTKGAWSGAKGAHLGIRRGFSAAGQSVSELSRRKEEARIKGDAKKSEKQERKAIKDELKREREEIVKRRQAVMLGGSGDESQSRGEVTESVRHSATPTTASLAPSEAGPIASDIDGDAMVSVTCSTLSSQGSVAATTTFSPWPGLLLTNTLVATTDEGTDANLVYTSEGDDSLPLVSKQVSDQASTLPPPPRRAPPPFTSHHTPTPAPMQDLGSSHAIAQQPTPIPLPSAPASESEDVTDTKQKTWTRKFGL